MRINVEIAVVWLQSTDEQDDLSAQGFNGWPSGAVGFESLGPEALTSAYFYQSMNGTLNSHLLNITMFPSSKSEGRIRNNKFLPKIPIHTLLSTIEQSITSSLP